MITFNNDDLKSYLKQKTGYEVSSIYSVDGCRVYNNFVFRWPGYNIVKKSTIIVVAYCDATKTLQYKDLTIKTFLWTETVDVVDFIKFIRLKKLNKINKYINK
jgi:hypothetical protein